MDEFDPIRVQLNDPDEFMSQSDIISNSQDLSIQVTDADRTLTFDDSTEIDSDHIEILDFSSKSIILQELIDLYTFGTEYLNQGIESEKFGIYLFI